MEEKLEEKRDSEPGGRSGFTKRPLRWEHTALNRTGKLNPFFLCAKNLEALGICRALLPTKSTVKLPRLQRKLNEANVKSFQKSHPYALSTRNSSWRKADSQAHVHTQALETSAQGTAPRRPPTTTLPRWANLILPSLQLYANLGVRSRQGGDRETCQERLLGDSNGQERWDLVPPAPKCCGVQRPSSEEDSHRTKNVTGKSLLKNNLPWEGVSHFHFHQSSRPQCRTHTGLRSCSLQRTLHPERAAPYANSGHEPAESKGRTRREERLRGAVERYTRTAFQFG